MRSISLQTKVLCHSNNKTGHHPDESWAIVSASKRDEDGECLNKDQIRSVEEISFHKGVFQAGTILEAEFGFRRAKVCHNLCKQYLSTVSHKLEFDYSRLHLPLR